MARSSSFKSTLLNDALVFALGASAALVFFWLAASFISPAPTTIIHAEPSRSLNSATGSGGGMTDEDPPDRTFYDDPSLSYRIEHTITDWDTKRREWLRLHPGVAAAGGGRERVLMVTGSQPVPCRNQAGDHFLLRFFKNKVDYCRRHGIDIFYNTALLHPAMHTYWAKYPLVRAAMIAHPEAEWIWWLDEDAIFTDMDFELPLDRYRDHNLVIHGWPELVYKKRSWVSINAGVFLIRNCQWSLDFMEAWASAGPQSLEYENWGKVLRAAFKDKVIPESDDQSALVYLMLEEKEKWGSKIYIEGGYYFQGYWLEIVGKLGNITEKYTAMERKVAGLRRRHAEKVAGSYGRLRGKWAEREGATSDKAGWRRPFVTHFTGCQPCNGDHNPMYTVEMCREGMNRALHFADDQVLRDYGFRHAGLMSPIVTPLPFDYPAAE